MTQKEKVGHDRQKMDKGRATVCSSLKAHANKNRVRGGIVPLRGGGGKVKVMEEERRSEEKVGG